MQVLPVADIPDRRYLIPKHPLGAKHLVLGNLSGQPSQDRLVGTRPQTAAGRELPHGLADSAEANAGDGRTGCPVHAVWSCSGG